MSKLVLIGAGLIFIGASLFVYLYKEHPIVLKVGVGAARVLAPPLHAEITVDGEGQSRAKCFRMTSYFNGEHADAVVLWLPEPSPLGREVLIIDRTHHLVGNPNFGKDDFYLLWDRVLFQSEGGSRMVPYTHAKSYEQDPELVITDHGLSFRMPAEADYFGGKRVQIAFQ